MTRQFEQAVGTVQNHLQRYERVRYFYHGYLGDGNGNVFVPDRTGKVYARHRNTAATIVDEVTMARSDVPTIDGWPVLIGQSLHSDELQVLGVDGNADGLPEWIFEHYTGPHHTQHEYGGYDEVYIQGRVFVPLRVAPQLTADLTVSITTGWVPSLTGNFEYGGTSSLDLSSYVPTTPAFQRWVVIGINSSTEAIEVTQGSLVSYAQTLTSNDIPTVNRNVVPLCAIRLHYGQTTIVEADLWEMRAFIGLPAVIDGALVDIYKNGVLVVDGATIIDFTGDNVLVLDYGSTGDHAVVSFTGDIHNLLSSIHSDTTPATPPGRGSLIVATSSNLWAEFTAGAAYQLLQMNAAGTDPQWAYFDWDTISLSGDMVHDHSSDAEGGQNLRDIQEFDFDTATELTISAGQITRTQVYHTVDTQGDAATDDLDTILGGTIGDLLVITPENDTRTIVVKHNTDNIWLLAEDDLSLSDLHDHLALVYDGSYWCDLGAGNMSAGGAGTITVRDDGVIVVAAASSINFTGDGVTASDGGGGEADVYIPATYPDISGDNGVIITSATEIYFTGDCVSLSASGSRAYVIIPCGGGISGVAVKDDNVTMVASATSLNFTGDGVVVTDGGGNEADIYIPQTYPDVQEDGILEISSCTILNFTGAGVTVNPDGTKANIIIPGGISTHNLLSATHPDTNAATPPGEGSLIVGNDANLWTELAHPGGAGYAIVSGATGTAWNDEPHWSNRHYFESGLLVYDDQTLVFGTDSDLTVTYDEALSDRVEVTGADWAFFDDVLHLDTLHIEDNVALVFGTDSDATILYDEAADDRVEVSGAAWLFTPMIDFRNPFATHNHAVSIYETALDTTADFYLVYADVIKTAGATDHDDEVQSGYFRAKLDQVGGEIGYLFGVQHIARIANGNVGDAVNTRGAWATYSILDLDGGIIYGWGAAHYAIVDMEAGAESTGSIYGVYISIDADGTVGDSVRMIHLQESSGVDYGIYQFGTAPHYLGGPVTIENVTLDTTTTYTTLICNIVKTAGASDESDHLSGIYNSLEIDQVGGTVGNIIGTYTRTRIDNGSIGSVGTPRYLIGNYGFVDLNGGTVWSTVWGLNATVDQEAASTCKSNVYCIYASMDLDGTVDGTAYMLYLVEVNGIDYGVYQAGTAPNYFGGNITIGTGNGIYPTDASDQVLGDAAHRWELYTDEIYFEDTSGNNKITIPDNVADGLTIYSDFAIPIVLMRFITTTDAKRVVYSEDGANVQLEDQTHLYFGDDDDTDIYYDELVNNRLEVAGATWYYTPEVQFAGGVVIIDNTALNLGTDNDGIITYDEAGDDMVEVTGADWMFAPSIDFVSKYTSIAHAVSVYNATLDTTADYYLARFEVTKVAGASDQSDDLQGGYCRAQLNQSGGLIGNLCGFQGVAMLTDGTVGTAAANRLVIGLYGVLNLDGGGIYGEGSAFRATIDIEAGVNITGDVYGLHIYADMAGTASGNVCMIHLEELTGIDYGILQTGTAQHSLGGKLSIENTTMSTTTSFHTFRGNIIKTGGATTANNDLYGFRTDMEMDDSGSTIGYLMGGYFSVRLDSGEVGESGTERDMRGCSIFVDVNAGTVWEDILGAYINVDIEGTNTCKGDVYGLLVQVDCDGDPDGSAYGIYLWDLTNMDYGIRQAGSTKNRLGGSLGIRSDPFVSSGTGAVAVHAQVATPSAGTYKAAYVSGIFDGENSRFQIISSNQGSWGSACHLTTSTSTWSMYSPNTGLYWYLGYDVQAANNENVSSASTIMISVDTNGHVLPGANKTQNLGGASNRWGTIYSANALNTGTSRLVPSTRDCPACGTPMVRGTGGVCILGEHQDYLLAFCPNCGTVAVETIRHRPVTTKAYAAPPTITLTEFKVVPMGGQSRQIRVDFKYGEDTIVERDGEPRRYPAPHNSTYLGETELAELREMKPQQIKQFLRRLGLREWEALEEVKEMEIVCGDDHQSIDAILGHLVGTDLR